MTIAVDMGRKATKTNKQNKNADQTARTRRLVCACVVRKPLKTGFLASRPNLNCAWVQIDKDSNLQTQDLLPHNWFRLEGIEDTIVSLRDGTFAQHELLQEIHYEQLFYVLDGVIKSVKEEQKFKDGPYADKKKILW